LNIAIPDTGSFKLDVLSKLSASAIGVGLGALARFQLGPLAIAADTTLLYCRGTLEAQGTLRAYNFSGLGTAQPDNVSSTLRLGYSATGWGYEASLAVHYAFGPFAFGLAAGYRNVPLSFGDLNGDAVREEVRFDGIFVGGLLDISF